MIVDAYRAFNRYFNPSKGDIGSYQSVLDRNKDKKIDYNDIEEACIRYLCGEQHTGQEVIKKEQVKRTIKKQYTQQAQRQLDVAERIFKEIDNDNSGYLEHDEVKLLMQKTYKIMGMDNYQPSREDIESYIRMTDVDNDGKITLDELQAMIIDSLRKAGIQVDEVEQDAMGVSRMSIRMSVNSGGQALRGSQIVGSPSRYSR